MEKAPKTGQKTKRRKRPTPNLPWKQSTKFANLNNTLEVLCELLEDTTKRKDNNGRGGQKAFQLAIHF